MLTKSVVGIPQASKLILKGTGSGRSVYKLSSMMLDGYISNVAIAIKYSMYAVVLPGNFTFFIIGVCTIICDVFKAAHNLLRDASDANTVAM